MSSRQRRQWRRLKRARKRAEAIVQRVRLPRVEIDGGSQWFVVRTAANMDRRVAREIEEYGAQTYVPVLVEERTRRAKKVEVETLPSSGYVFAGLSEGATRVLAFGRCEGALGVLMAAGEPSEVQQEALQLFADMLTGENEARRELSTAKGRAIKLRGLASLKQVG